MSGSEQVFAHGRQLDCTSLDGHEAVFHTGYNAHFGPVFGKFGDREGDGPFGHFLFEVEDRHLNGGGFLHGGVLMSLMDVALGASVCHLIDGPAATVSLNCDFTSSGQVGEHLEIETRITRRTRSIIFISGQILTTRNGSRACLLTATGVWKVLEQS